MLSRAVRGTIARETDGAGSFLRQRRGIREQRAARRHPFTRDEASRPQEVNSDR